MSKAGIIIGSVVVVVIIVIIAIAIGSSMMNSNNKYVKPKPRRRVTAKREPIKPNRVERTVQVIENLNDRFGDDFDFVPFPSYGGASGGPSIRDPTLDPNISQYLGGAWVGGQTIWLKASDTIFIEPNVEVPVPPSSLLTSNATLYYLLGINGTIYESADGITWTSSVMNNYIGCRAIFISGSDDGLWITTKNRSLFVRIDGTLIESVPMSEKRYYSTTDNTVYATIVNGVSTTTPAAAVENNVKWVTFDALNVPAYLYLSDNGRTNNYVDGTLYVFR